MQALSLGAVEVLNKPQLGIKNFLSESSQTFIDAIKAASVSNMKSIAIIHQNDPPTKSSIDNIPFKSGNTIEFSTTERIVAIGTSTGGTVALEAILTKLDVTCPGIVVVQHMPEKFTAAFAERLNKICKIEVREAANRNKIKPGTALIAPGNKHMSVKRNGSEYFVEVSDGPLVSRHRPSVDVLFRSVAKNVGKNAVGIIMTGMGDDGANGLKEIHDSGGITYAQDESSSVVFGMPKEAIKRGGVDKVVSLDQISIVISKYRS